MRAMGCAYRPKSVAILLLSWCFATALGSSASWLVLSATNLAVATMSNVSAEKVSALRHDKTRLLQMSSMTSKSGKMTKSKSGGKMNSRKDGTATSSSSSKSKRDVFGKMSRRDSQTHSPTVASTSVPKTIPTSIPSKVPSDLPSIVPSQSPSWHPSLAPDPTNAPPTTTENPTYSLDCECEACTQQVLQTFSGSFRCGDRIRYVVDQAATYFPSIANPTVVNACQFVGYRQAECAPCACLWSHEKSLYGVEWNGNLVVIDRNTGAGIANLGWLGVNRLNGAANDSLGRLLATRTPPSQSPPLSERLQEIYVIDPIAVTATLYLTLSGIPPQLSVTGLAIDDADLAYVILSPIRVDLECYLARVDLKTGVVTEIGSTGVPGLQGLAFGPSGVLYGYDVVSGDFGLVDTSTGTFFGLFASTLPPFTSIQSLHYDEDTNKMLGVVNGLYEFDIVTGAPFYVGFGQGVYKDVRGIVYGPQYFGP